MLVRLPFSFVLCASVRPRRWPMQLILKEIGILNFFNIIFYSLITDMRISVLSSQIIALVEGEHLGHIPLQWMAMFVLLFCQRLSRIAMAKMSFPPEKASPTH